MDDEVVGGWHLDAETRVALRLDSVRKALDSGDFGTAIIECEELLDEEPEHPEALFLLAEALLELNDAEGACEVYGQFIEIAKSDPSVADPARLAAATAGLAIARFETCDLAGAIEAAREAIKRAPDLAEAHFYLGLAYEKSPAKNTQERQSLNAASVSEFLAAHQLDPEAFPLPLAITPDRWSMLLTEAVRQLPRDLRTFWDGIPMPFEKCPSIEELRKSDPPTTPTVSGWMEGELEEDEDPHHKHPTSLRWFTDNLARLGDEDRIVTEMTNTLIREACFWLGEEPEERFG